MGFFGSLFGGKAKAPRGFAAFNEFVDAITAVQKSERAIIDGQKAAFSDDFRKFARSQLNAHQPVFVAVADCGEKQCKIMEEMSQSVSTLAKDLQPLVALEAEIARWRDTLTPLRSAAATADSDLQKAKVAFDRSPKQNRQAEQLYGLAQRKAEDAAATLKDQEGRVAREEGPYAQKFVEALVGPLLAMVDARIKAAQELVEWADEFREKAQAIQQVPDDRRGKLVDLMTQLEETYAQRKKSEKA